MAKQKSKIEEPEEFDLEDSVPEEAVIEDEKELNTLEAVKKTLSGCSLHFSWFGTQRAVPKRANETAANAIHANPQTFKGKSGLIDTKMPEWLALCQTRTQLTAFYNRMTFKYIVEGQRLFKLDMKEQIWGTVKTAACDLEAAAEKFQGKRDDIIAWAKANMGDAYDHQLFPADFTQKFRVVIREHSIEPPSYLRHTNAEEYKQALSRQLTDIKASMQLFEKQCNDEVGQAIGRMMNSLSGGGSFKQATLDSMGRAFGRIAVMKYEGTAAFKKAMSEAENVLAGVSISSLRHSAGERTRAREKLEKLLNEYREIREGAAKTIKEME